MKLRAGNLPVFVIADTFNRVVFVSQGYTIGLGRQIRQVTHRPREGAVHGPHADLHCPISKHL